MSDREGYLKRRDQLLMQDEEIAELKIKLAAMRRMVEHVAYYSLDNMPPDVRAAAQALLQEKGEMSNKELPVFTRVADERIAELEAEMAELKKAYNEMISQSQDQILELQAELADTVTECLAAKSNEDIMRKQLAELQEAIKPRDCAKCQGTGQYSYPSSDGYCDCPACNGKGY